MLFRLYTALLCTTARFCHSPAPGRRRRLPDQHNESFQRILPIALLASILIGGNNNYAFPRHAPSRQHLQSAVDLRIKIARSESVETQLDGGRDFVDVLTAWSRGTNETLLKLIFRNGDMFRHKYQ